MLQRFGQFIKEKNLFLPGNKVLLTVRGGLDSVVMVHLFFYAGHAFAIAHCNFQLRGEESEEDERFVQKLAEAYKVPFFSKRFETSAFADKKGISIQMAARELRYAWFDELIRQEGFDFFATAHHCNDNIETVLLNLTKGTDIHGLTGIKEIAGKAIRPLLFANREELETYAREKNLSWRDDSSNLSTKYQRNFIRHEVIPALKKINPSLENSFNETLEKLKAAERIFNAKVLELKKTVVQEKDTVTFIRKEVINLEAEKDILFFELMRPYGFNMEEALNLLHSTQTGKRVESEDFEAVNDREFFIITKKTLDEVSETLIPEGTKTVQLKNLLFTIQTHSKNNFHLTPSPEAAFLDLDKIEFPLLVRQWKEGDFFIPFGMKGKKKVSDFLIDQKIPLNFKQSIQVLVSGDTIAWIVGYRIDERFRITQHTEKILAIYRQNL